MDILCRVNGQKIEILTPPKIYARGTAKFVRFLFEFSDDWEGVSALAQFRQGNTHTDEILTPANAAVDGTVRAYRAAHLPHWPKPGPLTLLLYGTGAGGKMATTNCVHVLITDNGLIDTAVTEEISATVYQQVMELLQTKAEVNRTYETGTDRAEYLSDTLRCIASYLVHEHNSDCVQGDTGSITKFAAKYNDTGKSYLGIYGQGANPFTWKDKDGDGRHILYQNCSGFVSLLTKCRGYEESPYKYAFDALDAADNPETLQISDWLLRGYATELGSVNERPYTIDFKNLIYTYYMAYIQDHSGNPLKKILRQKAVDELLPLTERIYGGAEVANSDNLSRLEDGDILFFARPQSQMYKQISHCGYYISDLNLLNNIGQALYGVSFVAADEAANDATANAEWGYVAECGGDYPAGSGKNVIRVFTLKGMINRSNTANPHNPYVAVYYSKPHSNMGNSTKAAKLLYSIATTDDTMWFGNRLSTVYDDGLRTGHGDYWLKPGAGQASLNSLLADTLGARGVRLTHLMPNDGAGADSYLDINYIENGVYRCDSATLAAKLKSEGGATRLPQDMPDEDKEFLLLQCGALDPENTESARYGMQIIFPARLYFSRVYVRTRDVLHRWSDWRTQQIGTSGATAASTAASMTDTTKIYVYTGSEAGYVFGDWYYYNGSAWADGGAYNATAAVTDPTLSVSGRAADGKATGDAIAAAAADTDTTLAVAGKAADGKATGDAIAAAAADTDTTLTVANKAADGKATGDAIAAAAADTDAALETANKAADARAVGDALAALESLLKSFAVTADRKLYITDGSGNEYAGVLKVAGGKPVYEYDAV